MVRPIRKKRIYFQPNVNYFKPAGVPMSSLKESVLGFEELEAIRLMDSESLNQAEVAKKMKISQSTLSRLLKQGRKKLADAIINGESIRIQGGNYDFYEKKKEFCICPSCKNKIEHKRGFPCSSIKCTRCGNFMIKNEKS